MGKLVSQLFAENLIKMIDAKHNSGVSVYLPDAMKGHWFESVRYSYEMKEEDCHLDTDGYWISNRETHNKVLVKFWWRIEPNYCTAGRPSHPLGFEEKTYKNSENKKTILKTSKTEICLEWDGFDPPTETYWGLRMKPIYVSIYERGRQIYSGPSMKNRGWKKHLTEFINKYY